MRNTFPSGENHWKLANNRLAQAIEIMNRFPAHNNIELLPVTDLALVVSKENHATAMRIVNSEYGPDVANLGLNVASEKSLAARGMRIRVVLSPYIPNARKNYWFLNDLGRAKKMAFTRWGWQPRMNEHWEYRKGEFINDASVFFTPLILGFQWTFGSLGDDTAI